jgi:hypothetical protein
MTLHVLAFYLLGHYLSKLKFCENQKLARIIQQAGKRNARFLTLNQETVASHFLGLLQAHGLEDCRGHITKDAVGLGEAPALGCVGHDEWDLVGGVRGLGLSVRKFHLLGVAK